MDVDRMLEKCVRDQWAPDDVDYSAPPRAMTRDEEEAVVQYFHNMSAIERFAKALFEEQERRVRDARLKKIYATFVVDEERHAQVAERLARHYDVHHYKRYRVSPEIERFKPYFLACIEYMSDEVANAYITGGEIMLDVALLRSIDDYVADATSHQAMELINRDESRHIAVDYHMTEFYASPAYQDWTAQQPRQGLGTRLRAWKAFAGVLWHAGPFAQEVFFKPMQRTDPTGRRLFEAVKRLQLLSNRPNLRKRPFNRFMQGLRDLVTDPLWGPLVGKLARRLTADFPLELYRELFSSAELAHANGLTIDALADEALAAKCVA